MRRPPVLEIFRWGYPRPLEALDLDPLTRWIAFGDDCVFWYFLIDDSMWVHICCAPDSSFIGDVRRWHTTLESLAQLSGAERLRARPSCDSGSKVAGYLARLGWEPDPETGEGAMQRWV